jgi:hypothetical protein
MPSALMGPIVHNTEDQKKSVYLKENTLPEGML